MVECNAQLFADAEIDPSRIKNRLCPDFESLRDILQVKNSYQNKNERVSFSIEAVLCDE